MADPVVTKPWVVTYGPAARAGINVYNRNPPHLPRTSYHYLMLLEGGRVRGITGAMVDGDALPPHADQIPAVMMSAALRFMVPFQGLKRWASISLYKPHPDGFTEPGAGFYMASNTFQRDLRALALSARLNPEGVRFKLRLDTYFRMLPESGDMDEIPDSEFITVGNDQYHLPMVVSSNCGNFNVNTVAAKVTQHTDELQEKIDSIVENGSDRVFHSLIGTFAWSTVIGNAMHAGGHGKTGRGVITLPNATDSCCLARAIMAALDPYLFPRLGSSFVQLAADALLGAETDFKRAESRLAALPSTLSNSYAKRKGEAEAARSWLDHCRQLNEEAKELAKMQGLYMPDLTVQKEVDARRTTRRLAAIDGGLRSAFAGKHVTVDFSSSFFRTSQRIDDDTVRFIRSKIRDPLVKVQFWVEGMSDSAALAYPAPGANLAFLKQGGKIINLLAAEEHIQVMDSVSALCSALTASSQRSYCELCGFSVRHASTHHVQHARTLIAKHQEAGCPSAAGPVFPLPLSPANIRVLPPGDFQARFLVKVHGTLSIRHDKIALAVTVLTPWGRRNLPPASSGAAKSWKSFFDKFPSSRSKEALSSWVDLQDPGESTHLFIEDASVDGVCRLFSVANAVLLYAALNYRIARDVNRCTALREKVHGPCIYCKEHVNHPSRTVQLAGRASALGNPVFVDDADDRDASDSEDEVDREAHLSAAIPSADSAIVVGCPGSGIPFWAHRSCHFDSENSRWPRSELFIDVDSECSMNILTHCVLSSAFIESRCAGRIPSVQGKNTQVVRTLRFAVTTVASEHVAGSKRLRDCDDVMLRVKIRGPHAMNIPTMTLPASLPASGIVTAYASAIYETELRMMKIFNLSCIYFESDVAFSRAALYDSYLDASMRPVTSLVSAEALASYQKMTKGGRMLTGCSVIHPPLERPEDRSKVRLHLDFTAKYPHVPMAWPLPHEGHADRFLDDFSANLQGGIEWINSFSRDSSPFVSRVAIWGAFDVADHPHLIQFPPLFSRRPVDASELTPFQRLRLGVPLGSAPRVRSVSHLHPLEEEVVFQREAKALFRLGFRFTRVGEVRGCPASTWSRHFMCLGEERRMRAAAEGNAKEVADIKRTFNSVVGSTNMNMSKYGRLKTMFSKDVDPVDGFSTRAAPPLPGRSRRNLIRTADDPTFTGRVYATDDITMIERSIGKWVHKFQPEWALAVQAYARVDLLELWYGSEDGPGITTIFPSAKFCYGNTDSVVFEIELTEAQKEAGYRDARAALFNFLRGRIDVSNVPPSSSFWSGCGGVPPRMSWAQAQLGAGRWGMLKEETGMSGYEAIVVNGPNRWGARVIQSATDTLPKHVQQRDVMKMLPRAWIGEKPTLEMYAKDFVGAPDDESISQDAGSVSAASDAISMTQPLVFWGNQHAVVLRDGSQFPLGAKVPQVEVGMNETEM